MASVSPPVTTGSFGHAWLARLVYPAAMLVIAVVLYLPLLGTRGFHSHEGVAPYLRVLEYTDQVRSGHLLPQTFPRLFAGAGYAFPRFYPPLANLCAAALSSVAKDVVVGVHLSFLASILLSAATMYVLVAALTQRHLLALIGATAYVTFPYRFQDVFVRGALAESWSFVWYPLILLGGLRLQERRGLPWYLPVSLAGLVLSHPQMALYSCVVFLVLLATSRPPLSAQMVLHAGCGILLALGLSAWFWLPQQWYLHTVRASVPQLVWADVDFVDSQKISLLTALSGLPVRKGLRLSVGGVAIAANVLALFALFRPRAFARCAVARRRGLWLLIPWWGLLVFMVSPRPFLYVLPAAFGYIQFPWRLLGLLAFLSTSSFILLLHACNVRRATWAGLAVVLISVLGAGVSPDVRPEWTAQYMTRQLSPPGPRHGLDGAGEFLPLTLAASRRDYVSLVAPLDSQLKLGPQSSHGIRISSFARRGSDMELETQAAQAGAVVLPVIYYDAYAATGAGKAPVHLRDSLGLLTLSIPAGTQSIRITEHLTAIYRIAIGVSLLAGALCAVLLWRSGRLVGE
jgi:hypothetical protein